MLLSYMRLSSPVMTSGVRFASTFFVSETPAPEIPRNDSSLIAERSWATTPFPKSAKLELPVYDLSTGEFTGENVLLDHQHFNLPL